MELRKHLLAMGVVAAAMIGPAYAADLVIAGRDGGFAEALAKAVDRFKAQNP